MELETHRRENVDRRFRQRARWRRLGCQLRLCPRSTCHDYSRRHHHGNLRRGPAPDERRRSEGSAVVIQAVGFRRAAEIFGTRGITDCLRSRADSRVIAASALIQDAFSGRSRTTKYHTILHNTEGSPSIMNVNCQLKRLMALVQIAF